MNCPEPGREPRLSEAALDYAFTGTAAARIYGMTATSAVSAAAVRVSPDVTQPAANGPTARRLAWQHGSPQTGGPMPAVSRRSQQEEHVKADIGAEHDASSCGPR